MELLPGESGPATITVTTDLDPTTATVAWSLDGGTTWVSASWAAAAAYDARTGLWTRRSQVTLSRYPATAGTVVTRDVWPVLVRITISATVLVRPATTAIRLPGAASTLQPANPYAVIRA